MRSRAFSQRRTVSSTESTMLKGAQGITVKLLRWGLRSYSSQLSIKLKLMRSEKNSDKLLISTIQLRSCAWTIHLGLWNLISSSSLTGQVGLESLTRRRIQPKVRVESCSATRLTSLALRWEMATTSSNSKTSQWTCLILTLLTNTTPCLPLLTRLTIKISTIHLWYLLTTTKACNKKLTCIKEFSERPPIY